MMTHTASFDERDGRARFLQISLQKPLAVPPSLGQEPEGLLGESVSLREAPQRSV
jgi:hypothetical protein